MYQGYFIILEITFFILKLSIELVFLYLILKLQLAYLLSLKVVKLLWESTSTTNTLFPCLANATPRLKVVVVLPTPPFF